ncbi:ParB/RepB/Spo0J family partition protein [candidate division KSB1 bacterium]|nr:ParB/RepB/Spo0J family partition protein [Candidatus Aminicenantes bacterium]RQW03672.1 MAG: ParB/RepB/Spo0J family partition protein [candidate division KSB1 bacterium]
MKRNVLGKGIAAIISNEPIEEKKLFDIEVDNIYPNPFQPRKNFQADALRQLADSMKEMGVIQPVVVFKREGKYFLVVGERRWRAAQLLKWEKIPALVKEFSDNDVMAEALIENIQREELNAMEIAEGIEALISQSGEGQQEIADKLGMNRTTVTNFLRLLKLPVKIKEYVASEKLDQGHARALLSLKNNADMLEVAERIIRKKLSVRQAEMMVKNFYVFSDPVIPDPDILKMENRLIQLLSSRVKLTYKKSGTGKIEIFFDSLAEFERLFSILTKEKKDETN